MSFKIDQQSEKCKIIFADNTIGNFVIKKGPANKWLNP